MIENISDFYNLTQMRMAGLGAAQDNTLILANAVNEFKEKAYQDFRTALWLCLICGFLIMMTQAWFWVKCLKEGNQNAWYHFTSMLLAIFIVGSSGLMIFMRMDV